MILVVAPKSNEISSSPGFAIPSIFGFIGSFFFPLCGVHHIVIISVKPNMPSGSRVG